MSCPTGVKHLEDEASCSDRTRLFSEDDSASFANVLYYFFHFPQRLASIPFGIH